MNFSFMLQNFVYFWPKFFEEFFQKEIWGKYFRVLNCFAKVQPSVTDQLIALDSLKARKRIANGIYCEWVYIIDFLNREYLDDFIGEQNRYLLLCDVMMTRCFALLLTYLTAPLSCVIGSDKGSTLTSVERDQLLRTFLTSLLWVFAVCSLTL